MDDIQDIPREWTIGETDDRCGTCGRGLEHHIEAPDTLYCKDESDG